jgi:hypothetical protein
MNTCSWQMAELQLLASHYNGVSSHCQIQRHGHEQSSTCPEFCDLFNLFPDFWTMSWFLTMLGHFVLIFGIIKLFALCWRTARRKWLSSGQNWRIWKDSVKYRMNCIVSYRMKYWISTQLISHYPTTTPQVLVRLMWQCFHLVPVISFLQVIFSHLLI